MPMWNRKRLLLAWTRAHWRIGGGAVWPCRRKGFAWLAGSREGGPEVVDKHTQTHTTHTHTETTASVNVVLRDRAVRLGPRPALSSLLWSGRQATRQDGEPMEPMEQESRPCEATLPKKPNEPVVDSRAGRAGVLAAGVLLQQQKVAVAVAVAVARFPVAV
ncbi:hypothetical protein BD289DRAFT_201947 [Coniella lustricola]|uniref:Secreted protein n=1 Tax=Coniella lustricola TaxID=2025994 RepID=A0A2T3ACI9_9PEZI|nr:hypothetical protein BD289DRAFT_201947 [Coniella lustricola]